MNSANDPMSVLSGGTRMSSEAKLARVAILSPLELTALRSVSLGEVSG